MEVNESMIMDLAAMRDRAQGMIDGLKSPPTNERLREKFVVKGEFNTATLLHHLTIQQVETIVQVVLRYRFDPEVAGVRDFWPCLDATLGEALVAAIEEFFEPEPDEIMACDGNHDGTPCADPQCWRKYHPI